MSIIQKIYIALISAFTLSANAADWPPLPTKGFIQGRPASKADVDAGNAVFVAEINGVSIGSPMKITIPQYAYFLDNGKKIPVIVIQAEEAQDQKLIGVQHLDGQFAVGLIAEFELLGKVKPKQ